MTPERTQNRKNIRNPKHKFSSYFKMPIFFAKMKRYGQNGDLIYYSEANFQNPKIPRFPIHFMRFPEMRVDFIGSNLGITANFFNSVKGS